MRHRQKKDMWGDVGGTTAIEFAMIAPVFLALLLGIFHLSLLGFTLASLHYAVEQGARCDAISTDCPDVATYYYGPAPVPVFTHAAAACGASVSGTVTYDLNVLLYRASVPLSAAACFP